MVAASINADPVCECFECGTKIDKKEGYLSEGGRICDICAYELRVQEKPSAYYFDEDNEKFDKMAQEHFVVEDVWEDLVKVELKDDVITCSMCGDQEEKRYSWRYKCTIYCNVCAIEHCGKIIDKPRVCISIIPDDAKLIDDDFVNCDTYDIAKETLYKAICDKNDVSQELPDAYIISQQNDRFWYKLIPVVDEPTIFKVNLYACKDEVATKYLRRMLEDCIYRMDYILNPEDYPCEEDCATEEDLKNFYREQEENYDNYYSNKALCVTCGEINYAEPVCEVEGRSRMVCCDCIEIANCCQECNHLTLDYVYDSMNCDGVTRDLCFDCKFNKPLKIQIPLEAHLLRIIDIQSLSRQHFDILVDYAELVQLTIFHAYRYKSRCHFYDCDRIIPPSAWDAEEALQFCCKRHCEMSELIGCHCQNVYDGNEYDDEYEEATCKVCNNSNHETNMIPRIALRESDQGVKPIVSAICVFEEGIKMSNVLAESLVDLHEYFI